MNLLLPDFGLLFWMTLSFGIVFFVVARYGFPVIVRAVEERKRQIEKSLEDAAEAGRRLAGIESEKAAVLAEAELKRTAMLREAEKNRDMIIAEARETARRDAERLSLESRKQIELEREAALAGVRTQVGILAVDIAEKILRSELKDRAPQLELVNRLLDEIQPERPSS